LSILNRKSFDSCMTDPDGAMGFAMVVEQA
jgi:hypothetical protein